MERKSNRVTLLAPGRSSRLTVRTRRRTTRPALPVACSIPDACVLLLIARKKSTPWSGLLRYKQREEPGLWTMTQVITGRVSDAIDRDPAPVLLALQEVRVSPLQIVAGTNIDEEAVLPLSKEVPNHELLVQLGVPLRTEASLELAESDALSAPTRKRGQHAHGETQAHQNGCHGAQIDGDVTLHRGC